MRLASRFIVFTAISAVVLALLGATIWVTRYIWVPKLVNSQLNGVTLTELHGFTLVRSEGGIRADIEHLKLTSNDQYSIRVQDARITDLSSLMGALVKPGARGAAARSQLSAAQVSVDTANTSRRSSKGSDRDNNDSSAPRSGIEGDTSTQPTDAIEAINGEEYAQRSITEILKHLRGFPLHKLSLPEIHWPAVLAAPFALSIEQPSPGELTAKLRSTHCDRCTLDIHARSDNASIVFSLDIRENGHSVAMTSTSLTPTSASERWQVTTDLKVDTQRIPELIKNTGFQSEALTGWLPQPDSMKGKLTLALTGVLPDHPSGISDLTQVQVSARSDGFALDLPSDVLGQSASMFFSTSSPIKVKLHSLFPLSAASIDGKARLRTSLNSNPAGTLSPLFDGTFTFDTVERVSRVGFAGNTQLSELFQLLGAEKWQAVGNILPISHAQGSIDILGSFYLPGIKTLVTQTDDISIESFIAEVKLKDSVTVQLEFPENADPLQAIQWESAWVQASSKGTLELAAAKLPGPLDLKAPTISVRAQQARFTEASSNPANLNGQLSNIECTQLPQLNCSLRMEANLQELTLRDAQASVTRADISVEKLALRSTDAHPLKFALDTLNLTAHSFKSDALTVENPELFVPKANCELRDGLTVCTAPQVAVSLSPLQIDDNRMQGVVFFDDLSLTHHRDHPHPFNAETGFRSENLSIHALNQYQSDFTASGKLVLRNELVSGTSTITAGPLAIESSWRHNLKGGTGSLEITVPRSEFSPKRTLASAIKGLPVDLVEGAIKANGVLHWPVSGSDHLSVQWLNTALQYNSSFAIGINGHIALTPLNTQWVTAAPSPVSIDQIDAGISLQNINFQFSLAKNGDLTLGNFSAELLEGALTSNSLVWNIHGEERHSNLQFTGLAIGALAREMESTHFAASGLLDATIPITTDAQGITVEKGSVQSRPPGGRLRYYGAFSPSMLGSNPQLKLLAGALEDYNYRDIHGTINYPLSGDLKLNLKLTGHSKAIDANRDLIINLNLENNVPSMLRSLQASRDLTDVLERQVQ
ncbi:YdbH domain-containing protein [Microbulbifer sp. ARAS458-1]|uniref:intermembrane phospholipid transport protein YdbH family protein n=1 Tax=Microbulbifer sp. ARAS458-1 TaxID=3140242 RepID=UPI0038779189